MSGDIGVAVIGGSGLTELLDVVDTIDIDTPFGPTSAPITTCDIGGRPVAFVPRHGATHEHAPHRVNYRANLWALHSLGVRDVLGPFAAGALDPTLSAGDIVIPDQLVDRTWGRSDTFHDDFADGPFHAAFADPYDNRLRTTVAGAAGDLGIGARDGGTVVVIQGPRFGTRAESDWYARQGWHLVNMTQYPEAVLARELELGYAGIALVTDSDAGDDAGAGVTQEEVFATFDRHIDQLRRLLIRTVERL
ncbi:MAG: S-methyl-5'-thioadenosine phosphorylase [Actinobacteria bacterium]|nr:S-methyl-5'-thioadenosine phosphorylase [Actinomycetota bacterium]